MRRGRAVSLRAMRSVKTPSCNFTSIFEALKSNLFVNARADQATRTSRLHRIHDWGFDRNRASYVFPWRRSFASAPISSDYLATAAKPSIGFAWVSSYHT